MSSPLSFIIAIMVIAVVGEAVHEISKDRKRRSAEKTFDKQMSSDQRWIAVFRKECSEKTYKQPQIRILQIAANSINLPDYELVSKASNITKDMVLMYQLEITRRKDKFPSITHMEVVDTLKNAFPSIPEIKINEIREKLDKTKRAFYHICELEGMVFSKFSEWFSSQNDAEKKRLADDVRKLQLEAIFLARSDYFLAGIDAQQAILRLAIPIGLESGLSDITEVLKNTVKNSQSIWMKLIGETWRELESKGLSQQRALEATCLVSLRPSPRWEAFPLFKGEFIEPFDSKSTALSNFVYVQSDNVPAIYVIPLPLVTNVKETKHNGRSMFEFSLKDGRVTFTQKAGIPGLGKIQKVIKSNSNNVDSTLLQMLSLAEGLYLENIPKYDITIPNKNVDGIKVPELKFYDKRDKPVYVTDFMNKIVVIRIWGDTGDPSVPTSADFVKREKWDKFDDGRIVFLYVYSGDNSQRFQEESNPKWQKAVSYSLYDKDNHLRDKLGATSGRNLYILDPRGMIRNIPKSNSVAVDDSYNVSVVKKLLNEFPLELDHPIKNTGEK